MVLAVMKTYLLLSASDFITTFSYAINLSHKLGKHQHRLTKGTYNGVPFQDYRRPNLHSARRTEGILLGDSQSVYEASSHLSNAAYNTGSGFYAAAFGDTDNVPSNVRNWGNANPHHDNRSVLNKDRTFVGTAGYASDSIGLSIMGAGRGITGTAKGLSVGLFGETAANMRDEHANPITEIGHSTYDLLSKDIVEGVGDFFSEPIRGVANEGIIGGVKGVGRGSIKLVGKTAGGTVNVAGALVNGVTSIPYGLGRMLYPWRD